MLIRVGYDLIFDHPGPTPIIAMLYPHPSRAGSVRKGDHLLVEPAVPVSEYIDAYGNRCGRLLAPSGPIRFWNDAVIEDSGLLDEQNPTAPQHAIHDLPDERLTFLMPSSYCEVDLMVNLAWELFGNGPTGWLRVQTICDFVHNHIQFDYLQARKTRTAHEAYQERVGVCRDFTHLAVTLCRCMTTPARYCTGYLGDIGVPAAPDPMDFSAWFEAYVGGRWYTFDPRHNTSRIGRILMAYGHDAADVALLTSFGPSRLDRFTVWTDQVGEDALA